MRRNGHGRFSAWMPVPGPWMTSIGCLLAAIWSWPKSIRGNACSGWPRRSPSGSRTRTGPSAPLAGSANLLPAMCARGSRIAVRCRRQDGTFAYGVLICSLSPEQVLAVLGHIRSQVADPVAVLMAYVTFYDLRGGGIETSLKGATHAGAAGLARSQCGGLGTPLVGHCRRPTLWHDAHGA